MIPGCFTVFISTSVKVIHWKGEKPNKVALGSDNPKLCMYINNRLAENRLQQQLCANVTLSVLTQ